MSRQMTQQEMQRIVREAMDKAKNNPELQEALKINQDEVKKYRSQVSEIEDVKEFVDIIETIQGEVRSWQNDNLPNE